MKKKIAETQAESQYNRISTGLGIFVVCRQENVEGEVLKVLLDHGCSTEDVKYVPPREKDRKSKESAMQLINLMLEVRVIYYFLYK